MSFEQLIAVLRARWIVVLAIFSVITLSVTTITLLRPKTYTAVGSVVVDIKSPDPIAGMVLPGAAQPSFMMTQIDIATSARVAAKVVDNLKLVENPDLQQRWQESTGGVGDFKGWIAQLLRSGLQARPSRGSNVIYMSYESGDPNFAAAIVNAFIRAYLETSVEMRTEPAKQFNLQFDANAQQLRQKLQEARTRLSEFQKKNGLIDTEQRLDVETARLNELSSQLVAMQLAQVDSGSRQAAAQTRSELSPDVMSNPFINALKADQARVETQLEQLQARYGPQYPQVIELRSSLNDLRNKIAVETRKITGSLGVNNSVNASRVAQIQAALAEQRNKVLNLKGIRDQAAVFEKEVASAERALEGVTNRLQNTTLESLAQQSNVYTLESAVAPSIPTSPRVMSNIALGTVLAGIVALAVALLLEFRDRRIRTVSEVEALFEHPVIGRIPSFKKALMETMPPANRNMLGSNTEKNQPRLTAS